MARNVSEGCHLKADYWKVIARGGILVPDTCDLHVMSAPGKTQVLVSGAAIVVPPPSLHGFII